LDSCFLPAPQHWVLHRPASLPFCTCLSCLPACSSWFWILPAATSCTCLTGFTSCTHCTRHSLTACLPPASWISLRYRDLPLPACTWNLPAFCVLRSWISVSSLPGLPACVTACVCLPAWVVSGSTCLGRSPRVHLPFVTWCRSACIPATACGSTTVYVSATVLLQITVTVLPAVHLPFCLPAPAVTTVLPFWVGFSTCHITFCTCGCLHACLPFCVLRILRTFCVPFYCRYCHAPLPTCHLPPPFTCHRSCCCLPPPLPFCRLPCLV